MNKHSERIEEAVYSVLLEHSDGSLPVSPLRIANSLGIRVFDKAAAGALLQIVAPDGSLDDLPAFTIEYCGERFIVLDGKGSKEWRRTWLAHELGHFVLGEPLSQKHIEVHNMFRGTFCRSINELTCDLFAVNLLMPQAVLRQGNITTVEEIARTCNVHPLMAYMVAGAVKAKKSRPFSYLDRAVCDKFSRCFIKHGPVLHPRRIRAMVSPAVWSDISTELCY